MSTLERVLLLAGITAVLMLIAATTRAWVAKRERDLRQTPASIVWSALGGAPDGRPGLVVFSAPLCVACRTTQEPAVQLVEAEYRGALQVLRVDIAERPEAARALSILTAPSTVVLSRDGRIRAVNQGFASADRLRSQLSVAGASPA